LRLGPVAVYGSVAECVFPDGSVPSFCADSIAAVQKGSGEAKGNMFANNTPWTVDAITRLSDSVWCVDGSSLDPFSRFRHIAYGFEPGTHNIVLVFSTAPWDVKSQGSFCDFVNDSPTGPLVPGTTASVSGRIDVIRPGHRGH